MSEVIEEVTQEIIDLIPTNGQIGLKAFHYKVKTQEGQDLTLTVIAPSTTAARDGVKQQFPNSTVLSNGMSDVVMQVNDNSCYDVITEQQKET